MNSVLTPREDVLFAPVGDEGVLLHVSSGTYYALNSTGVLIWSGLANGASIAELSGRLSDVFQVEREVVVEDLGRFVQSLIEADCVGMEGLPLDDQQRLAE